MGWLELGREPNNAAATASAERAVGMARGGTTHMPGRSALQTAKEVLVHMLPLPKKSNLKFRKK